MKVKPIILAGGEGTRLWPFSSSQNPKQFLQIFNKKSLFQLAIERHRNSVFAEAVVITNEEYRFIVAEQLREINVVATIITEPARKNTAPCVMVAALELIDFGGVLAIIPADHLINDQDSYVRDMSTAALLVRKNFISAFGIKPDCAHVGYGYIEQGQQLRDNSFEVKQFIEKPTIQLAQNYINQSNYLWNSGIYLFKAQTLLEEVQKYTAAQLTIAESALINATRDSDFIKLDVKYYGSLQARSIDYAVMEKTNKIIVTKAAFDWTDVGSWPALWQVITKDKNNNFIDGNILTEQVNNCYINSNKLTAVLGTQDLIIINTDEITVISHKSQLGNMNNVISKLRRPSMV